MVLHAAPDNLVQKGIQSLQQKNYLAALGYFERAYSLQKTPLAASYFALCIATERGKISDAITLCSEAIEQDPQDPRHYLNLAKIYLKAKRKPECLETLRKGLAQGEEAEIRSLLEAVGVRKTPILFFLPRSHVLNRYLGYILSRLRLR